MFNRKSYVKDNGCSLDDDDYDEDDDDAYSTVKIIRKERETPTFITAKIEESIFDISKINDIVIDDDHKDEEDEEEEDILIQKKIKEAKDIRQQRRLNINPEEEEERNLLPEYIDEFELQQISKSTTTTSSTTTFIEIEREKSLLGKRIPFLKGENQILNLIKEEEDKLCLYNFDDDSIERIDDVDPILEEIIQITMEISNYLEINERQPIIERRERLGFLIELLKGNRVYENVKECINAIDGEILLYTN